MFWGFSTWWKDSNFLVDFDWMLEVRKENVIGHSLEPFSGACINPRYLAKTFSELSTSPCDLLLDAPITSTASIQARGRPSLKLS